MFHTSSWITRCDILIFFRHSYRTGPLRSVSGLRISSGKDSFFNVPFSVFLFLSLLFLKKLLGLKRAWNEHRECDLVMQPATFYQDLPPSEKKPHTCCLLQVFTEEEHVFYSDKKRSIANFLAHCSFEFSLAAPTWFFLPLFWANLCTVTHAQTSVELSRLWRPIILWIFHFKCCRIGSPLIRSAMN